MLKSVTVLFLIVLLFASTALAGRPHERDGFVIGFNLGGGTAQVKPDDAPKDDTGGGAGAFRLGWAFADQFMVGLESAAWVRSEDEWDVTLNSTLVNFTWYPAASGFFLRAGLGGGKAEATIDVGPLDLSASDTGGSYGVGLGHEWRLGEKFALGGALDYHEFEVDGGKFDFVNITAQFNWYF
ncbi:MAG: porin family protein [bacterium]|nr:porin family protein [bacterium]